MRKRVINHVADTIFWYILYFLPVLAYLMFVISAPLSNQNESDSESSSYIHVSAYTLPAGYKFEDIDPFAGFFSFGYDYDLLGNPFFDEQKVTFFPSEMLDVIGAYFTPQETSFAHLAFFDDYIDDPALGESFILAAPFTIYFPSRFPLTEVRLYRSDTSLFSIPLEDFSITSEYLGEGSLPFADAYDFKDFVNSMGFEFATDNIIVNSLADIFGTGGIMPMFDNDTPFIIFAWFIGVYLLHLLVDFLLFIPRIAHKWMKDCTGGD